VFLLKEKITGERDLPKEAEGKCVSALALPRATADLESLLSMVLSVVWIECFKDLWLIINYKT
jgi:hypothetical protein